MKAYQEICSQETDEDISRAASCLDRQETSLLQLKSEGMSREMIEACFLLSECNGSLLSEKMEGLRANQLAKRIKEKELRRLLEQGDVEKTADSRWSICRVAIVNALDVLQNGLPEEPDKEDDHLILSSDENDDLFYENRR